MLLLLGPWLLMLQVCFVFRVYFGFTLHGAQRRTDCFDAAVIKVFKMSGYNKLNCELSYEDRLRAYGLQTLGRGAGGGGGGGYPGKPSG